MIRAEELRIGNYIVDHEEPQKYFKIEQIKFRDGFKEYFATYRNGGTNCMVSCLEPIPLTEEILLKCGFERNEKYGYFEIEEFIVDKNKKGVFFLCDIVIHVEIKYLHQLQNLYFELTQKELEIKL